MGPSRPKAVCSLCGTKRSKLPSSWMMHDCLMYCTSCWQTVQCTACNRSDPKGSMVRGRWVCRACNHRQRVQGKGHLTEACHREIIEDDNGEAGLSAASTTSFSDERCRHCTALDDATSEDEEELEAFDDLAPLPEQRCRPRPDVQRVGEAGHVVMLLDASGSMRTVDVEDEDGPVPRLDAALRCAADFADVHAKGRPQDLFSCAAFGEKAETIAEVVDAHDLNNALGAAVVRGQGGTFYAEGFLEAAKLLALRPGASAHVVVLSDGRPADTKKALELFQREFVHGHHAGVRVHGIAFGDTVESFAALQQLTCISSGTFSLSGCSVRALCTAFSSVSSTISSMGSGCSFEVIGAQPKRSAREVDFELPEVGVFGKRGVLSFRANRTSFRYDGDRFHQQRWDACNVVRRARPYMRGGMRLVYGFRDSKVVSDADSWMVSKSSRFTDEVLNSRQTVEAHAKSTAVARHFAARFNEALKSAKGAGKLPTLFFVPCFVYEVEEDEPQKKDKDALSIEETSKLRAELGLKPLAPLRKGTECDGEPRHFSAERYLPGVFLKYNSNNGWVNEGALRHQEVVQAFMHFTFVASGGKLLVADLQGVARDAEVLLTDPQVLSLDGSFGPGDLGAKGMRACLAAHRCGPICHRLGMRPLTGAAMRRLGAAAEPPTARMANASCQSSGMSSGTANGWERLSEASVADGFALVDKASQSSGSSVSSWVVATGGPAAHADRGHSM